MILVGKMRSLGRGCGGELREKWSMLLRDLRSGISSMSKENHVLG